MPSGSLDPDPSNVHVRSVHDEVNEAVGAWLGAGGGPPGPRKSARAAQLRPSTPGPPTTTGEPTGAPSVKGTLTSAPVERTCGSGGPEDSRVEPEELRVRAEMAVCSLGEDRNLEGQEEVFQDA